MADNQQTKTFDLLEVRHFWLLSSMLKMHLRLSSPTDPKVLELCDDLAIMAKNTDQAVLRTRCEAAIAQCSRPVIDGAVVAV